MYDIIFITTNPTENDEYNKLKKRFPSIKVAKNFEEAKKKCLTRFFWYIPDDVIIEDDFTFSYKVDTWSLTYIHVFKNDDSWDGIALFPKNSNPTEKELISRIYNNDKKIEITASKSKPYDIVFISYQEPNADENYNSLKERFPKAKRVHGVNGIHNAHIAAAKLCNTEMFWIVDGDAQVLNDFSFSYRVPFHQSDYVYVWRSQNPINGLVYGYGGIKLFPRKLTINMDTSKPDMTTSISSKFEPIAVISNITAFNTDPFNTWKSAFRECVKLSSKIIDRQKDDETVFRLDAWCTVGVDRPYGKYAIDGAVAGKEYGTKFKNDIEQLKLINNFNWLKEKFDEYYN